MSTMRIVLSALALGALLSTVPLSAQQTLAPARPKLRLPTVPAPPPPLDYVLSSEGLAEPGMEGGRTELELADVNADGFVDLVSIGDHGSPFIQSQQAGLMVWFGDGAGVWTFSKSGQFGYGGVALGDVNGDGHMDAGYGMHHDYSPDDFGDQLMEVALGDGSGTNWTPWDDGLGLDGQSWGMFGTDFADVDGDGDLDIGSNSFGCCDGVHVYLNEGDGSWTRSFGFLGGNSSTDFLFGDVNGDGHADAVAGNSSGNVWLGAGDGSFVNGDGNLSLGTSRLHLGDVDGDGTDEVAAVASGGALQVWSWGPGNVWTPLDDGLPGSSSMQAAQLADMDGDGLLDLLSAGNGTARVDAGDGSGRWTPAWEGPLPGNGTPDVEALRAADVDHNGRPDFVLVQDETLGLFSSINRLHGFRESSLPTALGIRLLRPSAGRVWRGGQVRFVDWASAVPGAPAGGAAGVVRVEFSASGAPGSWLTLASAAPDNGRLQIKVPSGVSTTGARLRLTLVTPGSVATAMGPAFTLIP